MKNELFKKLFTIGLTLVVIVCIFSGCPTTGGGKEIIEPGTLTITGIPAEYEGKFVHVNELRISVTNDDGKKSTINVIANDMGVNNGKVKLPLYVKPSINIPFSKPDGYASSHTVNIEISFKDKAARIEGPYAYAEPDAVFESVAIKNGVAEVKWEDAFKAGYITITSIPEQYNDRDTEIFIGWVTPSTSKGSPQGRELNGRVINGTIICKIYPKEGNKYESYAFTGTKDIMVAILNGKERPMVSVIPFDTSYDYFLFKDAQITNGKVNLDLRRSGPLK